MKKIVLLLSVCALIGCAKRQLLFESPPVDKSKELTQKILIIGDSQQRIHGTPVLLTSNLVDQYVTDVTKRPIQQELFSKYLMKYIINQKDGGHDVPVVHLGDMLDVSCKNEWLKVKEILRSKKDFVLMPGNHDGFMQGNFYSEKQLFISSWAEMCDEGRFYDNQHMRDFVKGKDCQPCVHHLINTIAPKPYLINEYLGLVAQSRYRSIAKHLPESKDDEDFGKEWQNEDPQGFLQKIAWVSCSDPHDFERCNGYKNYLLQLVRLPPAEPSSPPVYLMLLDTAQYSEELDILGKKVLIHKTAGEFGEVQENQRRKALEWLDTVKSENGLLLLAGHHPFDSLSEQTRNFVLYMADKSGVRFYLSAHTHKGYWVYDRDAKMVELNVGSITDWPIHYRDLSIAQASGKIIVKSTHRPIHTETIGQLTGIGCRTEWFVDEASKLSVKNQEKKKILDFRMGQKAKTEATLQQYQQVLDYFSEGDTSKVSYVRSTKIKCDPNTHRVNFDSEQTLRNEVDRYLSELPRMSDYRNAARLANTINDYSCRNQEQETVMETYKICQALWASEADAKLSKAATLSEAAMSLEFSDYWKTRYDKLYESEKSRKVDSMVIMGVLD
jgi:hypothetical protein